MRPITTSRRRQRRPDTVAELLERRRLFFTLTIEGTSVADSISIGMSGNSILYVVNGVSETASNVLYDEIVVNANGGSDNIAVILNDDANQITVNGGAGNDTVTFGAGNDVTSVGDGVTFNGGDQVDELRIFNGSIGGTGPYRVLTSQVFVKSDADPIGYAGVEDVLIDVGPNGNRVEFQAAPGADVHVTAGTAFTTDTDRLSILGSSADVVTLVPAIGSPSATWGGKQITTDGIKNVTVEGVRLTLQSPGAIDSFSIAGGITNNVIAGQSGSSFMSDVTVASLNSFLLDVNANDASGGTSDFVRVDGPWVASPKIDVQGGNSVDTFTVNAAATFDTSFGTQAGQNARFNVNAALTLFGAESLMKVALSGDGASLAFTGSGALAVDDLEVSGSSTQIAIPSGRTLNVASSFRILANSSLQKSDAGTLNLQSTVQQTYQFGVSMSVIAGSVNFATDTVTSPNSTRNLDLVIFGGTVNASSNFHVNELSVLGGLFTITQGLTRMLVVDDLLLGSPNGTIDLKDNTLLVINPSGSADALTHVEQKIRSGFNNGTWSGIGIRTSRADAFAGGTVGYAAVPDVAGASGSYLQHAVLPGSVVARFTIDGDATLDRTTNFDDLLKLAANYNGTSRRWSQGDFTLDGTTNFDDLLKLATRYNGTLAGAPAMAGSGDEVPDGEGEASGSDPDGVLA